MESKPMIKREVRGWGIFTYHSYDGGKTWKFVGSKSSAQQGYDDSKKLEMQRIQRELK